MADKKDAKDKGKDAKKGEAKVPAVVAPPAVPDVIMTEELKAELDALTGTQRAAVLMLLLGEQQAAEIIRYLNPKEVQALGGAMVSVADLSQEAVNVVLRLCGHPQEADQPGSGHRRLCGEGAQARPR